MTKAKERLVRCSFVEFTLLSELNARPRLSIVMEGRASHKHHIEGATQAPPRLSCFNCRKKLCS